MTIFDTTGLTLHQTIIDDAGVKLLCYIHSTGTLILSAKLHQPQGEVFFETDDSDLYLFYSDKINLQALFEATAQTIVTVAEDSECKLYMRSDVDILLNGGEKMFSQFKHNSSIPLHSYKGL